MLDHRPSRSIVVIAVVVAGCTFKPEKKELKTSVFVEAAHGQAVIKVFCGLGAGLTPPGTDATVGTHSAPVADNGAAELTIPLTEWAGPGTYQVEATCKAAAGQSGQASAELVITADSLENRPRIDDCAALAKDATVWVGIDGRSCGLEPGGRWPVTLAGPAGATLGLPDGSSVILDGDGQAAAVINLGAVVDTLSLDLVASQPTDAIDDLKVPLAIGTSRIQVRLGGFVLDLLRHRTERDVAVATRARATCALIVPFHGAIELLGECETIGDVGVIATGVALEPTPTTFECKTTDGAGAPVTRAGEAYRLVSLTGGTAREKSFRAPPPRAGACTLAVLDDKVLGLHVLPVPRAEIVAWVRAAMKK